jgi:hypothetical protein
LGLPKIHQVGKQSTQPLFRRALVQIAIDEELGLALVCFARVLARVLALAFAIALSMC